MATQDTSLRDQAAAVPQESRSGGPVSLVVDRPSPAGLGVLILPFAGDRGEEAIGRQIGQLLQHRLRPLPDLTVGLGQLITTTNGTRHYVSIQHPLSADQARTCGTSWGAVAVLSGSITLQSIMRWTLVLRGVGNGRVLYEETLVGEVEDLLDAPGDVAHSVVTALGLTVDNILEESFARRETKHLGALLIYLRAADLQPHHGVGEGNAEHVRQQLLQALAWDPDFRAPVELLMGDMEADAAIDEVIAGMQAMGAAGTAGAAALARTLEEQGQHAPAARLLDAVLLHEPTQPLALLVGGQAAYHAGDYTRARALVQRLLEVDSEHAEGQELLGNLLAAGNRFAGAAIHWEVALAANPNQPKLLMRLGSYLLAAGEFQRAYDMLSRAMTLGRPATESLYQLGMAAYRLGLVREAITALHMAMQRDPGSAQVHALLARCYLRAGHEDASFTHDEHVLKLLPDYWPSAIAVGYIALNRGNLELALRAYTQVASARPDLPEALYGLGIALIANGMVGDGVEVLARAHELHPQDVAILCALIMGYLHDDRIAEAEERTTLALQIAPESPEVLQCAKQVRLRRQD